MLIFEDVQRLEDCSCTFVTGVDFAHCTSLNPGVLLADVTRYLMLTIFQGSCLEMMIEVE